MNASVVDLASRRPTTPDNPNVGHSIACGICMIDRLFELAAVFETDALLIDPTPVRIELMDLGLQLQAHFTDNG